MPRRRTVPYEAMRYEIGFPIWRAIKANLGGGIPYAVCIDWMIDNQDMIEGVTPKQVVKYAEGIREIHRHNLSALALGPGVEP